MLSQGRVSTAMSGTCHPRELPAGRYPEGEDTCRKSQSVISQPSPSQPSDCGRTIDDDLRTTAHPPCRLSSCPVLPSRSVGRSVPATGSTFCAVLCNRYSQNHIAAARWERGNMGTWEHRWPDPKAGPRTIKPLSLSHLSFPGHACRPCSPSRDAQGLSTMSVPAGRSFCLFQVEISTPQSRLFPTALCQGGAAQA